MQYKVDRNARSFGLAEPDAERRAAAEFARHLDTSLHLFRQQLHDDEAEAGSLDIRGARQTAERLEQFCKLIAFDDDTAEKLTQLGRDRMATLQDLADEAFADLLKKHGVPIDLKDALRKSSRAAKKPVKKGKPT